MCGLCICSLYLCGFVFLCFRVWYFCMLLLCVCMSGELDLLHLPFCALQIVAGVAPPPRFCTGTEFLDPDLSHRQLSQEVLRGCSGPSPELIS